MSKISKIVQKKFSNVFIAVIAEKNEYVLRYIIVKNGKIITNEDKRFPMDEDKKLSSDIKEFLTSLQNNYKFVYISYLLDSIGQNCIPTCNEKEFLKYNINKEKIVQVCVENRWAAYSLKSDIEWIKALFEESGIDFIFSPFVILNDFIKNKKQKTKSNLFLLYTENFITLMIFDKDDLVFSAFFKIPYKEFDFSQDDEEPKPEESESIVEGIELDNIESEDEEFDGFVDITKLDDDTGIEEEILESAKEDVATSTLDDLELYGREVVIFKFISSAIEEYYKNDIYESEFLEEIIIYNDSNISNDIITMIENDLFLDVEIHSIDIKEEMINMSIKEANL